MKLGSLAAAVRILNLWYLGLRTGPDRSQSCEHSKVLIHTSLLWMARRPVHKTLHFCSKACCWRWTCNLSNLANPTYIAHAEGILERVVMLQAIVLIKLSHSQPPLFRRQLKILRAGPDGEQSAIHGLVHVLIQLLGMACRPVHKHLHLRFIACSWRYAANLANTSHITDAKAGR